MALHPACDAGAWKEGERMLPAIGKDDDSLATFATASHATWCSLGFGVARANGKRMRHLEAADLWIHQVLEAGRTTLEKISDKLNPADLYTKYLSRSEIVLHMAFLGHTLLGDMGHEVGNKNTEGEWADEDQPENEIEDEDSEAAVAAIFALATIGCESNT